MELSLGSEQDRGRRPRKPAQADNVGAPLHLLVQALQRVRGVDPGAVLGGEVHVGQHIGLAVVDERRELWPLRVPFKTLVRIASLIHEETWLLLSFLMRSGRSSSRYCP